MFEDAAPRANDAPRPVAWELNYREGTYPAGSVVNGKVLSGVDAFSNLDGEPWEAPRQYATFGTYTDERGERCEVFDEEYILYLRTAGSQRTEGAFVGGNQSGVNERVADGESFVQIKGKYVTDAEFYRTEDAARRNQRFPNPRLNREQVITKLEEAAALIGPNAVRGIQGAIYTARRLGYSYRVDIAPIVEEPLRVALNAAQQVE